MGYRVKPFTMSVRDNSTQEFVDVGLLGSDVDADVIQLQEDVSNLKDKTEWIVTPQMFGAYGDGEHDDTNAISDAITFGKNARIDNEKTTILFPRGKYLISSTLPDLDGSIKIQGEVCEIHPTQDISYVFNIIGGSTIGDVAFIMPSDGTGTAIKISSGGDIRINRCRFWYGKYGIQIISQSSIFGTYITDFQISHQTDAGIYMDSASGAEHPPADTFISNGIISGAPKGIDVRSVSGLYANSIDFINCSSANLMMVPSKECVGCVFTNCFFDGNGDNCVRIDGQSGNADIHHITFDNCWFSQAKTDNAYNGLGRNIYLKKVRDITFNACMVHASCREGLRAEGTSNKNLIISNSRFTSISKNIAPCMQLINTNDSIINGNVFGGDINEVYKSGGYKATYPIVLNTCEGVLVTGNISKDNTNNDIQANSITNCVIKNNIGITDR